MATAQDAVTAANSIAASTATLSQAVTDLSARIANHPAPEQLVTQEQLDSLTASLTSAAQNVTDAVNALNAIAV